MVTTVEIGMRGFQNVEWVALGDGFDGVGWGREGYGRGRNLDASQDNDTIYWDGSPGGEVRRGLEENLSLEWGMLDTSHLRDIQEEMSRR